MGSVGYFRSADATRFPRGSRVVVRTSRGLEIGEVLAPPDEPSPSRSADGLILRGMTADDELLAVRLDRRKHRAFEACQQRLNERNVSAALIDVEHLFDGHSLFFYFLGEITPEIERLTAELAEVYEAKVKFRKFTDALLNGCGPNCGTDKAEGSCTSCATCTVAAACGARR
jgi:cell fate regulator YaaT (PSP1 superfamily)